MKPKFYWFAINGDGDSRPLRHKSVVSCLNEARARCVRDWHWKLPCWVSIQVVCADLPPYGEIAGSLWVRDDGVVVFTYTGDSY